MAAYDYRCRVCGDRFEVRHSITEAVPDVRCPTGHSDVARVWSAVAVSRSSAGDRAAASGGCCGGACGCG